MRSYPRRFREAGATDTKPGRATAVALLRAADDLYRVLVEDQPILRTRPSDVPAALDTAAERLALVIDRATGDDWKRTGSRAGTPVTALDIAREAVHEGAHQLRIAAVTDVTQP